MGDENTTLSDAEARHLLRRAGLGPSRRELDAIQGMTRGEAADKLLMFADRPRRFRPTGQDHFSAVNRWIRHLLRTRAPLQSKLALFWHDHFATGISKVGDTDLMAQQVQTLYLLGGGDMKVLVKAINLDPAMMEFLDTVRNRKNNPNENYARELMELFTLGVYDFRTPASENYTQADIVQIARAFTGWRYDRGVAYLDTDRHDYGTSKVIFTTLGGFGGAGRDITENGTGEVEVDTVTDILFEHRDLDGRNTVARRTAYRLLEYFAHPGPDLAVVDAMVTASGFASPGDPRQFRIKHLVRAILVHDAFYESGASPPYTAGSKKSVKWPVDYLVSTLRLLGVRLYGRDLQVQGGDYNVVFNYLTDMGQILLDPPSVFGWDWETAWISSSTLLARYGFARDVTTARDRSGTSFRTDRMRLANGYLVDLTDPAAIVDAVTGILGVTDQLTAQERDVLIDYVSDSGTVSSLDLHDYDTRQGKLHGLFALVLQSPAYQLH